MKVNRKGVRLAFVLVFLILGSALTLASPKLLAFQQGMENSPVFPVAETDLESLLLGVFFGLMIVMALYNLLLYFSLKDTVYLLYVATTVFSVLTTVSTNGLGQQYFWTSQPYWDGTLYITFAGVSIFFSSRFAAMFLGVKDFNKRLDQFLWLVGGLGLLMSLLSLLVGLNPIFGFARWLVLLSMPSYLVIGFISYRRGSQSALFYLIAWVPYILGVVARVLHGAEVLPTNFFTYRSIEIGGALEIVLLSFALADRIKGLRKEVAEKELEKEQFKTRLLQEQKVVLEQTVDERTKALREANATKDKFFSIIAHDLRSPMVGLQGVGQKLEYFIKKNKQQKLLEMGGQIDQSIDQLNHLLNNLLNWAASQVGGLPHHPDHTNLGDLVNENIKLYKSLAESREVTITSHIDSLSAYVDANAISTVIRNLLSNAIKFTSKGGEVTISAENVDGFSKIIISDEGSGMDSEQLENLFSGSLKSRRTGSEEGFGLGLKLCKEFVDMNQGQIEVESTLGAGTRFVVFLPAKAQGVVRAMEMA